MVFDQFPHFHNAQEVFTGPTVVAEALIALIPNVMITLVSEFFNIP